MSALSHSLPTGCVRGRNVEYVVSGNRYNIFEDLGPLPSIWVTPLAFVLFFAWPVAIGTISFFYCGEDPSFLRSLVPWLISLSYGHSRVLQAPTKPYEVDFYFQSWPVPPPDGYILCGDTWDHPTGDVLPRVQCEAGYCTLEGLGSRAQPLFRGRAGCRLCLEE